MAWHHTQPMQGQRVIVPTEHGQSITNPYNLTMDHLSDESPPLVVIGPGELFPVSWQTFLLIIVCPCCYQIFSHVECDRTMDLFC
jgi:hypothetical protein